MKITSLNKDIEKYHFLESMEYNNPGFKGHQIGIALGLKNPSTDKWEKLYVPGDTQEEKENLINEIISNKSLIILEEAITQFENNLLVKKLMYYMPYYVTDHSAYKPTPNFDNISYSMNIKQTIEWEVLLVEEWGNRYLNFKTVNNPPEDGRCLNFYEMIEDLETMFEEMAKDKENKDITIAEQTFDDYNKGDYLITFYDAKGEEYKIGFRNTKDILRCITSVRIVNYESEIIK